MGAVETTKSLTLSGPYGNVFQIGDAEIPDNGDPLGFDVTLVGGNVFDNHVRDTPLRLWVMGNRLWVMGYSALTPYPSPRTPYLFLWPRTHYLFSFIFHRRAVIN